jgi:hypothetical protein
MIATREAPQIGDRNQCPRTDSASGDVNDTKGRTASARDGLWMIGARET